MQPKCCGSINLIRSSNDPTYETMHGSGGERERERERDSGFQITCRSPPLKLPPVNSMVRSDVTGPPPMASPVLLMVVRIEFSMLP